MYSRCAGLQAPHSPEFSWIWGGGRWAFPLLGGHEGRERLQLPLRVGQALAQGSRGSAHSGLSGDHGPAREDSALRRPRPLSCLPTTAATATRSPQRP